MNQLEKSLHSPVAYVRGNEKRFSGCSKPGAPRHYHVLLAAIISLDSGHIKEHWYALAGRRSRGAGADVRRYDPSGNALAYCLKFINQRGMAIGTLRIWICFYENRMSF